MKTFFFLFKCTCVLLFITCTLLGTPQYANSDQRPLRIVFVSPHHDETYFWGNSNNFARCVAQSLQIDFSVIHNRVNNRSSYLEAYNKAFNSTPKPDFVIGTMLRNVAQSTLELSKEYDIPVFIVNSDVPFAEQKAVGGIRKNYPNYLGHMLPDEKKAGKILTLELIRLAQQKKPYTKHTLLALSGHRECSVAVDRAIGLQNATEENNATLKQLVYTDWSPEDAYYRTKRLINRHKDIDILWYISDDMALKAIELNTSNRYTIGGFDWNSKAIEAIKNGQLDASVGGHFTEVGFALIMLYDYYHGRDFAEQYKGKIHTPMIALTKNNLDKYYNILTRKDWNNINFKAFSKTLNSNLKNYDFSFENILKHYRQQ